MSAWRAVAAASGSASPRRHAAPRRHPWRRGREQRPLLLPPGRLHWEHSPKPSDPMSKQTVLVIDDERDIRELLTITLGRMELDVDAVGSVNEARSALANRRYDLCFTDMRLPDGSGQEIIELIAANHPDMPV